MCSVASEEEDGGALLGFLPRLESGDDPGEIRPVSRYLKHLRLQSRHETSLLLKLTQDFKLQFSRKR